MQQEREMGYSIRTPNGELSLKKFKNTLDYSLDAEKLKEIYHKVTRRKNFSFTIHQKSYTQQIINVTFKYAYKAFNKASKNIYIRSGYCFRDCTFQDGVCISDEKLIAIQTGIAISNPLPQNTLGNHFTYDSQSKTYIQVGVIPTLKTRAALREALYTNGFICDGISYVRYKRSSGSSRVGKCLFINQILYPRMDKWDQCGLSIKNGNSIDLAAYEAYISLTLSSNIDFIQILPENILIIDDYESKFTDNVIAVEEENGTLAAAEKEVEITNRIWDGQSLLDISLFEKYADKGMLLLRNRFFKSCAFNCNVQKWFADQKITKIQQLNGFTLARDVRDIKLITTPSSIKYLKFGTITQWLKNIDATFGIVKHEKEPHYFSGRMVRTNYQLLNTLQLSYDETKALLQPTLDYIYNICSDPDILRYHIAYPYKETDSGPLHSKNEIIFKCLGINNQFTKTKLYADFRNDLVRALFDDVRDGKILVNGNYSTLFGNGMEMLKAAIDKFDGTSELRGNEIRSTRFGYGQTLLGCRSPHVTMGNIALLHNVACDNYGKYFNLTNEIVCMNSIGENILQRLQGADFDSDTILLTDHALLIQTAQKNYSHFKVPVNMVAATTSKRCYTPQQQADLDVKTSVNKIGENINLSQQLNSLLWDQRSKDKPIKEIKSLYLDICKLSVLSGIEIDKAKKEFLIETGKELAILKKKYEISEDGKTVKPHFLKRITLNNGFKLSEKVKYKDFDTTMDYVQTIVNSFSRKHIRKKQEKYEAFISMIKAPNLSPQSIKQGHYYKQKNCIMERIKQTKSAISALYHNYDMLTKEEKENVRNMVHELRQECIQEMDDIHCSQATLYLLLKEIDKKENKDIARFVFGILFGSPNKPFFEMMIHSKEILYELKEAKNGTIQLYNFLFNKQPIP